MTTIKLKHDFIIEVDENNFTLKHQYISKRKSATLTATKTHGYYMTLEQAIREYIKLATLDANDGETLELHELLEKIKAVCDETIEVLKHG